MVDATNRVVFEVTPSFSESGSVEYSAVSPIHMPGAVQVYKNTNSRSFSIGAHLISRTPAEVTQNMQYLQQLRAWRYPYFGSGSSTVTKKATSSISTTAASSATDATAAASMSQVKEDTSINVLGAPPDILYLYAYTNSGIDKRESGYMVNINRVPVVLTNLEINYPDDVDYWPSSTNYEPFPVKMDVSISLVETHSPREFEAFSLSQYRAGALPSF